MELRDALGAAVQAQHPSAWCWTCLAGKLSIGAGKLRDAAQILLFAERDSFIVARRTCAHCGYADQLLVFVRN